MAVAKVGDDEKSDGDTNLFGVHYFGFKVFEPSALDSMQPLFEKIKERMWPEREKYPLVHRAKFNVGFKNLNLWAADFGPSHVDELAEAFEKFTEEQSESLKKLKVKFSDIECKEDKDKISVSLRLDPEDQKVLEKLQAKLIEHFRRFQKSDFVKKYDLQCSLLFMHTCREYEEVESIVRECFNEIDDDFEVQLGPFILSQSSEIIHQFPERSETPPDAGPSASERISRSLWLLNLPTEIELLETWNYSTDPFDIIRSLAELIEFELVISEMIEDSRWEQQRKGKRKIVVVFKSSRIRDVFFMSVKRYLAENHWRLEFADLVEDFPEGTNVSVRKALPGLKVYLRRVSDLKCYEELPLYRAGTDPVTFDTFLQRVDEPRWVYYFETLEELEDLVGLLEKGDGTEYISPVLWNSRELQTREATSETPQEPERRF